MSEDNQNPVAAMGWAMATLLMIPLWPLIALWRGYAIATLWGWFVVPAFSLAPLSIYSSVGLVLVFGAFKGVNHEHDERTAKEKFWSHAMLAALLPGMMIAVGAFWKWLQWGT